MHGFLQSIRRGFTNLPRGMRILVPALLVLSLGVGAWRFNLPPVCGAANEQVIDVKAAGRGTPELVRFSADGRWLAVSTSIGVSLYDAHTLAEVWFNMSGRAQSLVFSPDSTILAASLNDSSLRLLHVNDGMQVARLQNPGSIVVSPSAVTFSADGTLIASGTSIGALRIWRVADAQLLDDLGGFATPIMLMSFAPDGARLISVNAGFHGAETADKPVQVRTWQVSDGTLLSTISSPTALYTSSITFPVGIAGAGTLLIVVTDNQLKLLSTSDMSVLKTLDARDLGYALNRGVVSADGSLFALGTLPAPGVMIWSVDDTRTAPTFTGNATNASSIALSSDNQSIAATFMAGTVHLWPLQSGALATPSSSPPPDSDAPCPTAGP